VRNKVIGAAEAVNLIKDNDFVAIQGAGGGVAEPTAILKALGERYQRECTPWSDPLSRNGFGR
jgi:acyl CoA:acetate/3-ketoacid CoA transferase